MAARPVVLRATVVFVSLIGALLAAEGAVRVFHLAPSEGIVTVTEAEFQSVPGIYSPNQDLIDLTKRGLPHHVHINSLGYRGPEFARTKVAGEMRILMAGDSFTYGDFVNDDDTMPAQLERDLQTCCAGARVINAGVVATSIDTQARMIGRALPLKPDLVILTFTENDLLDLAGTSTWDQLAANRAVKSRPPVSLVYPLLKHLALWQLALEARAKLNDRLAGVPPGVGVITGPDWGRLRVVERRLLHAYKRELVELHDRLRGEEIDLLLVLFPSHYTLQPGAPTELLDWITQAGKDTGVPTVNLLSPLLASGLPVDRLYLLPEDGHASARAYDIAARFLAARIAH